MLVTPAPMRHKEFGNNIRDLGSSLSNWIYNLRLECDERRLWMNSGYRHSFVSDIGKTNDYYDHMEYKGKDTKRKSVPCKQKLISQKSMICILHMRKESNV